MVCGTQNNFNQQSITMQSPRYFLKNQLLQYLFYKISTLFSIPQTKAETEQLLNYIKNLITKVFTYKREVTNGNRSGDLR